MTTTCTHTGPHALLWNVAVGEPWKPLREVIAVALHHVDPDTADGPDTAVVRLLMKRAQDAAVGLPDVSVEVRSILAYAIDASDDERESVRRAMDEAADYMAANDYADASDFPDDQHAAQVMSSGSGAVAYTCFAHLRKA